jgi:hypothetical protein
MRPIEYIRARKIAAAVVVLVGLAPALASAGTATQRPLSDFLDAQGTQATFFPPVSDYIGWGSIRNARSPVVYFTLIDYAGLANKWLIAQGKPDLGTEITGNVVEKALKDGSAEVSVTLKTRNALAWAAPFTETFDAPAIFGATAADVDAGATPALADVEFRITFSNTEPGAPLPDLIEVFYSGDYQISNYAFQAHAKGEYCNGETGSMTVSQTGAPPRRSNVQASIINFGRKAPDCP